MGLVGLVGCKEGVVRYEWMDVTALVAYMEGAARCR
jgi:hypothetical protein